MADDREFQIGSGNWLRSGNRSSRCSSPSSSTTYVWPTQVADITKPSHLINDSSNSAVSAPPPPPPYNTNMALFEDSQKSHLHHATDHSNLQMIGLGLSSQPMDWNQSLLRRSIEKCDDNSFGTLLHEDHDLNSNTNFQQHQWPRSQKMMMYSSSSADSEGAAFSSLTQAQLMSSHHQLNQNIDHNNSTNFQLDSSSIQYQNNPSTTTLLPGLLRCEINQPPQQQSTTFNNHSVMNNYTSYSTSYGMNSSSSSDHNNQPLLLQPNPWQSNKPQNQLHLSNNTPFWNASAAAPVMIHDVRPNYFPSLQMQSPSSTFDEKPKKSSTSETSNKRPRNETTASPLPANKVRKEKMGDRITALQQLVSPFGKTDTASVLSEAIEYIKFLHEQVSVLSNAYMKTGAPIQPQQKCDNKSKDTEGQKQNLRSKGLCLVPVSSTFPVTHETTVDFWNPTFGGTFR